MTRTTNARIAGVAYLLYIVAGLSVMMLSSRARSGKESPRNSRAWPNTLE